MKTTGQLAMAVVAPFAMYSTAFAAPVEWDILLDSAWATGKVLSLVGLLFGAYVVLTKSESFLCFFGKKGAAAPHSLSANDVRLMDNVASDGACGHILSGNAAMDAQHQSVFDDANILRATILSGRPVDEIGSIVDKLIRDAVEHFRDEEALLAATNYPRAAKHAALHHELVNSAEMLLGRFRAGTSSIGELFHFLAHDFITKHMLTADREFIHYLESRR